MNIGAISPANLLRLCGRGSLFFIRHRTEKEISEARAVNVGDLPDPQTDEARAQKPEWLILVGVSTHLGCVPLGQSGDYQGGSALAWFALWYLRAHPQRPCTKEPWSSSIHIRFWQLSSRRLIHRSFNHGQPLTNYQPKNGFTRWLDARLPILRMAHDQFVAYPVPRNLNYFWTFGAILMFFLAVQILTGIVLALHYAANAKLAFDSVEHIMRDVNYGWLHPLLAYERCFNVLHCCLYPYFPRYVLRLI